MDAHSAVGQNQLEGSVLQLLEGEGAAARRLFVSFADIAIASCKSLPIHGRPRLESVYEAAVASGALFKTDSTDQFIEDGGIEFVVRVAASLREKAKTKKQQTAADAKAWRDPFDPHEEALFVQNLGPDHKLLLNKFNVVAHHCLVVTNDFQNQTDALTAGDLGAAWQVIQAMPEGGVCYFNCGSVSGASQPHKHLQIVPLPFAVGRPAMPTAHVFSQACGHSTSAGCTEVRALPYQCFACGLPPRQQVSAAELLEVNDAVLGGMKASIGDHDGLSYNVLLTAEFLAYVPRSRESSGPADVNALGFAGTLFVRSEEEVEYLRQRGILQLLMDDKGKLDLFYTPFSRCPATAPNLPTYQNWLHHCCCMNDMSVKHHHQIKRQEQASTPASQHYAE